MSQSNLAIPNESGAAFRADVNAALQALVSQSAGANAPVTTYPLQLWADTTNALLKIRNAANSAWITLGTLDKADLFVGATLDGAKLIANSVTLAKMARGTLNQVILGQGPSADPIWGVPVFDASVLVDGSVLPQKLAPGVIKGKVKALIDSSYSKGFESSYYYGVIMDNNTLRLVGYNPVGNLGYGSTVSSDMWVDARYNVPPSDQNVKKVVRSFYSTYVQFNDGKVYACGNNSYGQLGLGDTTNRREFTRIEYFVTNGLTVTDVFVHGDRYAQYESAFFLCSNGSLYACGYNGNGEIGVGDTANRATPTQISGAITNIIKVVGSAHYTFLLTSTGSLYATGYNNWGTLGLGDTTSRSAFQLVSNLSGVADIKVFDGRTDTTNWSAATCALARLANGDLYATGYNGYGQLGLGDTTQRNSFTKISTLASVADFGSFGGGCYGPLYAVTAAGNLYTWGYNGNGAIGDGTTTNRSLPWQVVGWTENTTAAPPFSGKIAKVLGMGSSLGHQTGVVLDTDGNLWAVGRDSEGQCGTDAQTYNTRFTRVRMPPMLTSEKITDINCTGYDNLIGLFALTNQGRIFATGYNGYGQTGTNTVRTATYLYTLQPCLFS